MVAALNDVRSAGGKSVLRRGEKGLRRRLALWGAVLPVLAAGAAQGDSLYWDINGATANTGTTAAGTWDATTANWNTDSTGVGLGMAEAWAPRSTAVFASGTNFTGGYSVMVSGTQTASGITFEEGTVTLVGAAVGGGTLDLESGNATIQTKHSGQNYVQVPITGSGTLTISNNTGAYDSTINLDGQMSGFTGNIVVGAGASATQLNKLQMDWQPGDGTATITLNSFSELGNNNQVTLSDGTKTPLNYTVANPIAIAGSDAWLACAAAPAGSQKIVTYAGNITGAGNLWVGINNSGGNGTVVLEGNNTYGGNTYIVMASGNGLVQLGSETAIPATTNLVFGPQAGGTAAVAALDMNGHNLTVASLANSSTGNIRGIINTNSSATGVTLTLNQNTNTSFSGPIGSTNLNYSPFTDRYGGTLTGNANISLVKNGTGALTLSGGVQSPAVTVNGGSIKFSAAGNVIPAVTINSGATATFTSTNSTTGALLGGAGNALSNITLNGGTFGTGAGNVIINGQITANGGTLAPGGAGTVGNMVLSGGGLTLNSGATLGFDYLNAASFDTINAGGITLDSGPHGFTFNLLSGGTVTPGTYTIATANGINWDGTNGFSGGTIGAYNYGFTIDSNHINLVITPNSPVLRWSVGGTNPVTEGDGDWSNGSGNFINLVDNSPATWSNSSMVDVIVGGDTVGGTGGTISLGSNVMVNGKVSLEPEIAGFNYVIGNGAGNTLTLNPSANTPGLQADTSAGINAPVVLGASQTWTVNGGSNALLVSQPVTQANAGTTLTKNGSGLVILSGAGGSISGLSVTQGAVLIQVPDAIGATTPVSLDTNGEYGADASLTFANPVSVAAGGGQLVVSGGNTATMTSNITAAGPVTKNGAGVLVLQGTNNTFASTFTMAGGVGSAVSVGTAAPLGNATIVLNNGGLTVTAPMTLTNNFTWSATGTNGQNDILDTGSNSVTLAGSMSGTGDWYKAGGGTLTITGSSTAKGGAFYVKDGSTIVLENVNALGLATIALDSNATFDVETPNVMAAYMRGNTATGVIAHKTGTGNLTLASPGSSVPGSNPNQPILSIDAGSVTLDSSQGLGGNLAGDQMSVIVNGGAELIANYVGGNDRVGGSLTLNGGTVTLPATAPFSGSLETDFMQAYTQVTTAGVITSTDHGNSLNVTASSTIRNLSQSVDATTHLLGFQVPVTIQPGATLTVDNENSGGFDGNNLIAFRGAQDLASGPDATHANAAFPNDAFTIAAGGTLVTRGPGQVRFGRNGAQGKIIVGQGTSAGSESLIQFGTNAYLNDGGGTNAITRFIVSGSGNAGLRIEAAMNATYRAATDTDPTHHDGSTGLFGQAASGASNFTVLSANRLAAMSAPYGSPALSVGGTLTVAANDATDVAGAPMTTGPAAASPLTLAFDNTASSANANLTYQLDGSGAGGGNIANFAHLQVEQSHAGSGSVRLKLAGNTKIADLVLLNNTSLNLSDKLLAVDYTGASVQQSIVDEVNSGKNGGAWNGPGINSSALAGDTNHITTLAMFEASDYLGISGTDTGTAFGLTVDATTLLMKPAYYGDINLDGRINGDDYALMDRAVAKGLPAKWFNGDFNADGLVNSQDYFLMDRAFGISNGGVLSPGLLAEREAEFGDGYVTQLVASVPEPTAMAMVGLGMMGMAGRRRRRGM